MPQIAQPTGLSLMETAPGVVGLSWVNNEGGTIIAFQIWRSSQPASGFVLVSTTPNVVGQLNWSASISGHLAGATYYYYVVAISTDPLYTPSLPSATASIQMGVDIGQVIPFFQIHIDPADRDVLIFREFTHVQPDTPTGYPAGYDPSNLPAALLFFDVEGNQVKSVDISPRTSTRNIDRISIEDLSNGLYEVVYQLNGDGSPFRTQFMLKDYDLECCIGASDTACTGYAMFHGMLFKLRSGRLSEANEIYATLKKIYNCQC